MPVFLITWRNVVRERAESEGVFSFGCFYLLCLSLFCSILHPSNHTYSSFKTGLLFDNGEKASNCRHLILSINYHSPWVYFLSAGDRTSTFTIPTYRCFFSLLDLALCLQGAKSFWFAYIAPQTWSRVSHTWLNISQWGLVISTGHYFRLQSAFASPSRKWGSQFPLRWHSAVSAAACWAYNLKGHFWQASPATTVFNHGLNSIRISYRRSSLLI